MPFPESVRIEVRRRAAFRCCRCNEIGIDAHHIIPSSEGGPDTVDNAAPLCQNCHDRFGDNPRKRKEIRQMRDWWYEVVAEKWPTPDKETENLNNALLDLNEHPAELDKVLDDLRRQLGTLARRLEDEPTADVAREVATGLVDATQVSEPHIALLELERNIEDLRHRIANSLDATPKVYWQDLLASDVFEKHERTLAEHYPEIYKEVADAYRAAHMINQRVPEERLGTPIPPHDVRWLRGQLGGEMAHASALLLGRRPKRRDTD